MKPRPATPARRPAGRSAFLELAGVTKSFRGGAEPVLANVSLALAEGEAALVAGPSGGGKTTLLNLAGALDRPDKGMVIADGMDIASMPEADRALWRAERVGHIFQHHFLPLGATARDCVAGPLIWGLGWAPRRALAEADTWLERVGLADLRRQKVQRLSGGQRQRVAFARALAPDPALLLADEPTAQLDPETGARLANLLHEAVEQRDAALLIVSHEAQPGDWRGAQRLWLEGGSFNEQGKRELPRPSDAAAEDARWT